MQGIMLFAARHSRIVLTLLLGLTLLAASRLPDLKLEITAEGMMVSGDPAREFYLQVRDSFGAENVTIIYLEDPDLLEPDNLRYVKALVEEIEASPLVLRSDSLFSVRHLRTVEGYTYTDPYFAEIPASRQEAEELARLALLNPLVADNLLSGDRQAMAINVYLDSGQYWRGMDEEVVSLLSRAIAPLQEQLETVFFIGDPAVRNGLSERIKTDQRFIVPLAMLLLLLTLVITLRRLNAALIPLLTAAVSVIWILGLMAWLQVPVNVMTSIVPALLIIIGSTEDIHLLTEYHAGLDRGKSSFKAIKFMARNMGTAVALTFITTYFGFLSIALNELELLRQFGLVASAGLAFNFLITLLLVPALLKWRGSDIESASRSPSRLFSRLAAGAMEWVLGYRLQALVVLTMLLLLAGYGATRLEVNNNVMSYFDEEASVTRAASALHERLSGIQTFSVVVTGQAGAFLQVANLEALQALQEFIQERGRLDKSISYADFMSVVHGGLDSETPGVFYLPERDEIVEAYMAFLDEGWLRPFVSPDFSQARIIVRHDIGSSRELNTVVDEINRYVEIWGEPGLEVRVTGEAYLNNQAVDYMAEGQARSLLLMLVVILVIISLLFLRFKAGLIAMLVNLFPIVMLFGVMGWLGLPLDTGTAMVGAIAMGIAVDHTMHFMVRYQRASRKLASEDRALRLAVEIESVPIISTSLALAMGFSTLMISDFPPVARFGALSAMVMLMAVVGTFVILPLLLKGTRLVGVWELLSVRVRREVLAGCPLFQGMKHWQVRRILAASRLQHYLPDEVILRQGDTAEKMYVLLEGEVGVWRNHPDGSIRQVSTLQAGEVFGVTALLGGQKRSASVVAVSPSTAVVLSWQDVHHLVRYAPRIASRLFQNLSSIVFQLLRTQEVRSPVVQDEFTQTYNAAYLANLLEFAVAGAERDGEPLSVLRITLAGGDASDRKAWLGMNRQLRQVARTIKSMIRRSDLVGRWNQHQFWVVLPNTDAAQSAFLVHRLLLAMNEEKPSGQKDLQMRLSVIQLKNSESAGQLLERLKAA